MYLIDMIEKIQFGSYLELALRLLLALILGGFIGFERENLHRPAGFRTHILVCVGSALVMITSEFIFRRYSGQTNADPARLGAQVISGIGFLGAGTIMREGLSVKGLTTAASLWTVSCVGIAIGIGFYEGAIVATIVIYLTLIALKRMQLKIINKKVKRLFYIYTDYKPDKVEDIKKIFSHYDLKVKDIEFVEEFENTAVVRFLIQMPCSTDKELFVTELLNVGCIHKIYEY